MTDADDMAQPPRVVWVWVWPDGSVCCNCLGREHLVAQPVTDAHRDSSKGRATMYDTQTLEVLP